jgi:hypothetical protein
MERPVEESMRRNGWSWTPHCPWVVVDEKGRARCSYTALREHTSALTVARYTLFHQGVLDEMERNLREGYHGPYPDACSPEMCPSRYNRLANRIQGRNPRIAPRTPGEL